MFDRIGSSKGLFENVNFDENLLQVLNNCFVYFDRSSFCCLNQTFLQKSRHRNVFYAHVKS